MICHGLQAAGDLAYLRNTLPHRLGGPIQVQDQPGRESALR
jgi:hypothetical protein